MSGPQPHRHKELLDFIRSEVEAHGIAPSVEEMRVFMGVASKSGINTMLFHLESRCLIRRIPRRARAIQLVAAKDYHRPDCNCAGCADTRYFEQLKLVKGLKVDPPVAVARACHDNIRPLDPVTRLELLGKSDIAAPRTRKTALPPRAS